MISAYTVHYQKRGENEKQVVLGNTTHNHIVRGLHGYTNYSLYVRAFTKVIGRKSKAIVQRTLQGSKSLVFISIRCF